MLPSLSVSLVVYQSDIALLKQTLSTLYRSAVQARTAGLIAAFFLAIVDNADSGDTADYLSSEVLASWPELSLLTVHKPGNIGYGAGHNLAINVRCEAYHLVLNPDVKLSEDAISQGLVYLSQNQQVGLLSPYCLRPNGSPEFLCKAYPSVATLFLRGFAPSVLKTCFQKKLSAYEIKVTPNCVRQDIRIASGCFMLFQRSALQSIKGFCEDFFLYFEDFDLSLRLTQTYKIAFVPSVSIVHYGGKSAKKGIRHIVLFVRSATLFFNRHGWRFW